jgi:3-dehydro-L-gulonate 2-dehydrogenase
MRILPMGYWKGSGFAIMLDVLAAVLSEGAPTNAIDKIQEGSCTGCSQIFILIDPAKLGGENFTDDIANGVVDYVHESIPAEDSTGALYPGENALNTRQKQMKVGILVDDGVWSEVRTLAAKKS